MPNYAEMSLEELDARGRELRTDFSGLRSAEQTDENSAKALALIEEKDDLDFHYTIARHQATREALAKFQAELPGVGVLGAMAQVHGAQRVQSIGELIRGAEATRSWVDGGGVDRNYPNPGEPCLVVVLDTNIDGQRAALTEWTSSGPGNSTTPAVSTLLPVGQPIPPVPRQGRLGLRDLIPSVPTQYSQVPYVRELNPTSLEGGASAVLEGGTKPDVSLGFVGKTAVVTVVAVNLSPTRQLWADAPLVVNYINQRLPYLIRFREDKLFIDGGGTWPDIEGIRKSGNGHQSQSAVSGEYAQTIAQAIAKIEEVDGDASGIVMNPTDAWTMFSKRAAGGSGTFDAGTPFSMNPLDALTVWGLPTVRSRVYASGKCLVGDFRRGATILDREQVNIQVYPQHSTYAAENTLLVQAEERVGLMLPRPDFFVDTTVA